MKKEHGVTITDEQAEIIGGEIGKELGAAMKEAIRLLPPEHRLQALKALIASVGSVGSRLARWDSE